MAEQSVTQSMGSGRPSQLRRRWRQVFQQALAAVPLEAWRCVSIDVGKYEHVAEVYDGRGRLLAGPRRFGIRHSDYQAFFAWVDSQLGDGAARPVFGLEPTGHYYEQLAYEIGQRYGQECLFLVQSGDVARRRGDWNQNMHKDDPVDAGVINELLRDGQGRPYQAEQGPYLALYHLERYRWALEQDGTRLKNQIIGHVDRLYPGLVMRNAELAERYQALFRDLWRSSSARRLLTLYPDPAELRTQTAESLFAAFRRAGYWMSRPYAAKILAAVQGLCRPEPDMAHWRSQFLSSDLERLGRLEQRLTHIQSQMAALLDDTWGRFLRPTGVDVTHLACLVAVIGDMRQYRSARQLFGRSGLHPRTRDSGLRQRRGQGERIVRPGDRHLRRQLMRFTTCMIARHPALAHYHTDLLRRGKGPITADIAVARRLCGLLHTLATKEVPFDPQRYA